MSLEKKIKESCYSCSNPIIEIEGLGYCCKTCGYLISFAEKPLNMDMWIYPAKLKDAKKAYIDNIEKILKKDEKRYASREDMPV